MGCSRTIKPSMLPLAVLCGPPDRNREPVLSAGKLGELVSPATSSPPLESGITASARSMPTSPLLGVEPVSICICALDPSSETKATNASTASWERDTSKVRAPVSVGSPAVESVAPATANLPSGSSASALPISSPPLPPIKPAYSRVPPLAATRATNASIPPVPN